MNVARPPLGKRAAALTSFLVVAMLGYTVLRLWGALDEPDPRTVGPSEHIGYYWRVALALWFGTLAGVGGWRWSAVGELAARALPWAIVAAVLQAVLVP